MTDGSASDTVTIPGSGNPELRGRKPDRVPEPDLTLGIQFFLRSNPDSDFDKAIQEQGFDSDVSNLAEMFMANTADMNELLKFVKAAGLSVVDSNHKMRFLHARGTLTQLERAFHIRFGYYDFPHYEALEFVDDLAIPKALDGILQTVIGMRRFKPIAPPKCSHDSGLTGMNPRKLLKAFDFPKEPKLDPKPIIGIIEMGGGCYLSDFDYYFREIMGFDEVPQITLAYGEQSMVDGQATFGNPSSIEEVRSAVMGESYPSLNTMWTMECTSDTEVAGSLAPNAHLQLYIAKTQEDSSVYLELYKILYYIIFETPLDQRPQVLTISLALPERKPPITALDHLLQILKNMGITTCVASGDSGGSQAFYPATSASVLSCGGSTITLNAKDKVATTQVWNETIKSKSKEFRFASTGGQSKFIPVPDWQKSVSLTTSSGEKVTLTHRATPDVASVSTFTMGIQGYVAGIRSIAWGTSAAAPLWAALVTQINAHHIAQHLPPLGFFTDKLYTLKELQEAFLAVEQGNNNWPTLQSPGYVATKGWDACTGWGNPLGAKILQELFQLREQKKGELKKPYPPEKA